MNNLRYPDICVLDFEATCDDVNNYPNEIIEFPSILLRWDDELQNYKSISEFREFVKPLQNNKLSQFCMTLTGIQQIMVDQAADLPDVLNRHYLWLSKHSLELGKSVIIMTCGWWDLCTMLPQDSIRWKIIPPHEYLTAFNIKEAFRDFTGISKGKGMTTMLDWFELKIEGRHHSGIDDCRNISRIFIALIQHGYLPWTRNFDWKPNLIKHISKSEYKSKIIK